MLKSMNYDIQLKIQNDLVNEDHTPPSSRPFFSPPLSLPSLHKGKKWDLKGNQALK